MRLLVSLVLAFGVLIGAAAAQQITVGGISFTEPWVRATAGAGKTSAAYVTFTNKGKEADRLIGAESPVAERVELHRTVMDGNVMKMEPIEAIELPPGVTVDLSPGGHHIMLMGLKQPLKAGTSIPLTLIFDKAGRLQIPAKVRPASAT